MTHVETASSVTHPSTNLGRDTIPHFKTGLLLASSWGRRETCSEEGSHVRL